MLKFHFMILNLKVDFIYCLLFELSESKNP